MNRKYRIVLNAPISLGFVFICLAATLMGELTGGVSTRLLFMNYRAPLLDPLTWLRFVTHIFGHADWDHFIGNAAYLLLLGPILEEKYGPEAMLRLIGVTALATGVINFVLFPYSGLCGASGVVFAFILLSSFTNFREGEIPVTFILVALFFIGQQVYEGLMVRDSISNLTHIVGGAVGAFFGHALGGSRRRERDRLRDRA
ncbi:MAG: rhomboid family intramembrane serine protease [bacterium]